MFLNLFFKYIELTHDLGSYVVIFLLDNNLNIQLYLHVLMCIAVCTQSPFLLQLIMILTPLNRPDICGNMKLSPNIVALTRRLESVKVGL